MTASTQPDIIFKTTAPGTVVAGTVDINAQSLANLSVQSGGLDLATQATSALQLTSLQNNVSDNSRAIADIQKSIQKIQIDIVKLEKLP